MESYNKEHADNPIDIQYTDADASAALIDLYNGCYDDIMNLFKPSAIWEGIVRIVPNIPQTLEIAAAAAVIGIVLGFLLALCRIKKFPVLSQFATLYISFMRGTPLLVQLFLSYYGRPAARPCAASFCHPKPRQQPHQPAQVYLARVYHRRDGHAGQGKGRRGQQYALF